MWIMVWLGRIMRSCTYFILVTDHCLFRNVAIWYPRHNLDQYLVLGCLHSTPLREHTEYLGRHTRLPLHTPTTPTREDRLFAAVWRSTPKSKAQEARNNMWISTDTWRIVNERVSVRRDPARDKDHLQRIGHVVNASLREDGQRWTEESGEEI